MISTLVQLIVIMPYNHSYDRQLLIPASFECFSLSQLHRVDGGNVPACTDTDTQTRRHTDTHTHKSGRVIIWSSVCSHLCSCTKSYYSIPPATGHCPVGIASHFLAWLDLNVFYWPYKWERNSCPRISRMAKHQILGKHIILTLFQALDHSTPTCKWQQGSCRRRGNKPRPWWWMCKLALQYLALGWWESSLTFLGLNFPTCKWE